MGVDEMSLNPLCMFRELPVLRSRAARSELDYSIHCMTNIGCSVTVHLMSKYFSWGMASEPKKCPIQSHFYNRQLAHSARCWLLIARG